MASAPAPSPPLAGPSNAAPTTLKLLLIGSSVRGALERPRRSGIVLTRAQAVGKSSLLLRYSDALFLPEDETTATLGVDQRIKMIERQGRRWRLAIWDTAGQERFRCVEPSRGRADRTAH